MEELLASKSGPAEILAILVIVLSARLVWSVITFIVSRWEKKDQLTDATVTKLTEALRDVTYSIKKLDARTRELDLEVITFKQEIRKILEMVRHLSGPNWEKVKQAASSGIE